MGAAILLAAVAMFAFAWITFMVMLDQRRYDRRRREEEEAKKKNDEKK